MHRVKSSIQAARNIQNENGVRRAEPTSIKDQCLVGRVRSLSVASLNILYNSAVPNARCGHAMPLRLSHKKDDPSSLPSEFGPWMCSHLLHFYFGEIFGNGQDRSATSSLAQHSSRDSTGTRFRSNIKPRNATTGVLSWFCWLPFGAH